MGALLILAHCSDQTGARTLQDVLEGVCGRPGLIACSSAVALYCFGTCITFLIIIGDQFDRGACSIFMHVRIPADCLLNLVCPSICMHV